ncbi:MAG: hypothetical protein VX700_04960 [Pseudomonadota bacterium]|nr:hypothetical protein [Pseudomonadota bacterium]
MALIDAYNHVIPNTYFKKLAEIAPDPEGGTLLIRETINALENLDISRAERDKIYSGNLKRLLKIS